MMWNFHRLPCSSQKVAKCKEIMEISSADNFKNIIIAPTEIILEVYLKKSFFNEVTLSVVS